MVSIPNGAFNGAPSPIPIAGVAGRFPPHWAMLNTTNNITTTINRLYFIPYWFPAIVSYTGIAQRNSGAGDNTEVWRAGVYQASPTTGLPSTLVIDAGEGTLTGAAAERLLATAWTPPYVGWGYLAFHASSAAAWSSMSNVDDGSTAVGMISGAVPARYMFGVTALTLASTVNTFAAYYVDTAYGALATNAVAPTNITSIAPIVAPYRT